MSRRRIKDREALADRHVKLHAEGLSLREIAKVTGVGRSTVQTDLRRHRADLLQPWPKARRLAWLVAHPHDENYPWKASESVSDSPSDNRLRVVR